MYPYPAIQSNFAETQSQMCPQVIRFRCCFVWLLIGDEIEYNNGIGKESSLDCDASKFKLDINYHEPIYAVECDYQTCLLLDASKKKVTYLLSRLQSDSH